MSVAVRKRRVKKIHPELDRFPQRSHRLFIIGSLPHLTADSPGAESDLRNVNSSFT
jgi:hypothetical protein